MLRSFTKSIIAPRCFSMSIMKHIETPEFPDEPDHPIMRTTIPGPASLLRQASLDLFTEARHTHFVVNF